MKRISYVSIVLAGMISATVFTGCSDDVQKEVDEYSTGSLTFGSILYSDGTTMGVTRSEDQVNGGFSIYHVGTGEVIGFIGADGSVNDIGGNSLGVCTGATVSDNGLSADCKIPIANPNQAQSRPTPFPVPTTPATPDSACSRSSASGTAAPNPAGCEDRRDGTFNVTWDQQTCQSHGYFYCTLSHTCTDQTINIPECI